MIQLSFSEILHCLSGDILQTRYHGRQLDRSIQGLSIDTRTLEKNNLFCALSGTQVDGHDFLMQAYQQGAAGALVTRINPNIPDGFLQCLVHDVPYAMGLLTREWRSRFSIPSIAITGSNGKTSVKNMVSEILKTHTHNPDAVLYPERTFNNHIGVPLTLSKLNHAHQYAVLELGMNHFHEIAWLTSLVKPNIAAITLAGPSHLAGVGGSLQGVAEAKSEIFLGLSDHGIGILNRDDAFFDFWKDKLQSHALISFGFHPQSQIRCLSTQGSVFTVQTPEGQTAIRLPLLGKHQISNALTAIAIAFALSIPLSTCKQALENMTPTSGRMTPVYFGNHSLLIDDTYNASPLSLKAALETLESLSPQFKNCILILGAMRELGEETQAAHNQAGLMAKKMGVSHLLAYGPECQDAIQSFGDGAHYFQTQDDLCKTLQNLIEPNTLILVKGSRSTRMENICRYIQEQSTINDSKLESYT